MTDETMIAAVAYLTIEPEHRGSGESRRLVGARIAKLTQGPPDSAKVGAAVVRLRVAVPRRVFEPFLVHANVDAAEGDVGVARVTIEPFAEEPPA